MIIRTEPTRNLAISAVPSGTRVKPDQNHGYDGNHSLDVVLEEVDKNVQTTTLPSLGLHRPFEPVPFCAAMIDAPSAYSAGALKAASQRRISKESTFQLSFG